MSPSMLRGKLLLAVLLLIPSLSFAAEAVDDNSEATAAEAEQQPPSPPKPAWNEFESDYFTMRFGYGFLVDTVTYRQDSDSEAQMNLAGKSQLRDMRLLLKGRFPQAPRLTYSVGYMYDGGNEEWRFRQTGIQVAIPEYHSRIFIGRTKETFSTSKIMVGYFGWTNERSAANDAMLPILNDGVKWMVDGLDGRLIYSFGIFKNLKTPDLQNYVKTEETFTARAVWLPLAQTDSKSVLHLAAAYRHGTSVDGKLQYRSKPESYEAQSYAIDTGKFPASTTDMVGLEAYYRPGPLMFGSEYYFNKVESTETNNPLFQGGEVFMAYMFTGEVHPYNKVGAYFDGVKPSLSAFAGGLGALEFVLRYSYADLDSELIKGGKFQRITPMFNWYLSENARLEFVYGYSVLDRFDLRGETQYFQTRLQLSL